jgi:hypothetical protein
MSEKLCKKNCGRESRLGACFSCAELQSILVEGEDMYDKKVLSDEYKGMSVKDANKIIELFHKKFNT